MSKKIKWCIEEWTLLMLQLIYKSMSCIHSLSCLLTSGTAGKASQWLSWKLLILQVYKCYVLRLIEVFMFTVSQSVSPLVLQSCSPSVSLSVCLFVCLSVHLSVGLSVSQSISQSSIVGGKQIPFSMRGLYFTLSQPPHSSPALTGSGRMNVGAVKRLNATPSLKIVFVYLPLYY